MTYHLCMACGINRGHTYMTEFKMFVCDDCRDELNALDYIQPRCPACGVVSDYCSGHGSIGDPEGYAIIRLHDAGLHGMCHDLSDCVSVRAPA